MITWFEPQNLIYGTPRNLLRRCTTPHWTTLENVDSKDHRGLLFLPPCKQFMRMLALSSVPAAAHVSPYLCLFNLWPEITWAVQRHNKRREKNKGLEWITKTTLTSSSVFKSQFHFSSRHSLRLSSFLIDGFAETPRPERSREEGSKAEIRGRNSPRRRTAAATTRGFFIFFCTILRCAASFIVRG